MRQHRDMISSLSVNPQAFQIAPQPAATITSSITTTTSSSSSSLSSSSSSSLSSNCKSNLNQIQASVSQSSPLVSSDQHQRPLQQIQLQVSSSRSVIRSSPFRPFISPQPNSSNPLNILSLTPSPENANLNDQNNPNTNPNLNLSPIPPLAAHQAATIGLTKDQKQLLWTWSLSFQCVVHIGVRGTESIRTRVVEAGVIPIIISVLGGYLHEIERAKNVDEVRERAMKMSALTGPTHLIQQSNQPLSFSNARSIQAPVLNTSMTSPSNSSSNNDNPNQPAANISNYFDEPHQPPRPILSSRTLALPPPSIPPRPLSLISGASDSNSAQSRIPPPRLSLLAHSQPDSASLDVSDVHRHQRPRSAIEQYSARSDGSGTLAPRGSVDPIMITRSSVLGLHTGSVSPSSVSSSSSLETSRLASVARHAAHSVTSDTLSEVMNSVSTNYRPSARGSGANSPETEPSHTEASSRSRSDIIDYVDEQSAGEFDDDNEADVKMGTIEGSEPGPSTAASRSRRGTIKANHSNPSIVHISPLAPPRPTLTELSDVSLPLSSATNGGPMEGVENELRDEAQQVHDIRNPSIHITHLTPRASAASLPAQLLAQSYPQQGHSTSASSSLESFPITSGDVDMEPLQLQAQMNGHEESDSEPPSNMVSPRGQRSEVNQDNNNLDVISTVAAVNTDINQQDFPEIPTPTPTVATPNPDTVQPHAETVAGVTRRTEIASPTPSPATLGFRDEDVLLALQLLAYLSKYPHVRAHFHEPASPDTLELTYGTLEEANWALSKFICRFKGEKQERERNRESFNRAINYGSSGRRPVSAHGHESISLSNGSSTREQTFERLRAAANASILDHHQHHNFQYYSNQHYAQQPHRSVSSFNMRERLINRPISPNPDMQSRGPDWSMDLRGGRDLHFFQSDVWGPSNSLSDRVSDQSAAATNCSTGLDPMSGFMRGFSGNPGGTGKVLDSNHSNYTQSILGSASQPINPLASNVFSYVERFTHQRSLSSGESQTIPNEIQYWAGVIMRNACRKDEDRGGIRQCANMQCGKWEGFPREFAKCRRCRKAKYCSKICQSRAWQLGHRCCTKTDGEGNDVSSTAVTNATTTSSTVTDQAPQAAIATNRMTQAEGADDQTETTNNLVDVAIERLRRGARSVTALRAEAGSNIATPADREPRVDTEMVVRENAIQNNVGGVGREEVFENVEEGERLRTMIADETNAALGRN
ncbi:hypothetical protein BY996DRAFT_2009317 [Phakopsora pachyrhizi]|nr:hypothetical protein BY996DRAFT_2009317 [Phakopsora pachyrhizi]